MAIDIWSLKFNNAPYQYVVCNSAKIVLDKAHNIFIDIYWYQDSQDYIVLELVYQEAFIIPPLLELF